MRDLKIVFSILFFFMPVSQCSEYDVHGSLYQYFTLNLYQQQLPTTIHVDVRLHYVSYPHFTQKAVIAAIKAVQQLRQQQESAVTLPTSVVMPSQQKLIPSDVKIISSLPKPVVEIDAPIEFQHSIESAKYDTLAIEQIENQLYEYDQSHRWCNSEAIIGLRQNVFNKVKNSNQKSIQRSYVVSDNMRLYCDAHSIKSNVFEFCQGDEFQQLLHGEFVEITQKSAYMWHGNKVPSTGRKAVSGLADFVVAGVVFNKSGCVSKALVVADACWAFLDCIQAIGEGVIQGSNAILDDCVHPVRTIVAIIESAATCGYYIGRAVVEVGQLGYCALADVNKARHKFVSLSDDFKAVCFAIKEKQKTLKVRDVVKEGVSLGVQCYATSRVLSGVEKLFCSAQKYAAKIAKKIHHSADKIKLLTTPEGIMVRVADNAVECIKSAQKLAKKQIIVVQNMYQFFKLPFGKLLKENSIKTPYRYQNPIYKLTNDIPDKQLKKGYFYYVDRLHWDHVEVFDESFRAAAVYNLDGTFNDIKFSKAFGRSIRKIMKGK